MATQDLVLGVGVAQGSGFRWSTPTTFSNLLIDPVFLENSPSYLIAFDVTIAGYIQIHLETTDTFTADSQRNFLVSFETNCTITLTAGSLSLVLEGITDADSEEPYFWPPSNFLEVAAFYTAYVANPVSATLTLDDNAGALVAPSFTDDTGDAQTWTVGTAYHIIVPAASGTPAPTYAASGLPAGIAFDTATRVISGTPSAAGSGTITVTATNSEGTADWTVAYTTTAAVVLAAPSFADDTGDAQSWTQNTAITPITVPEATGTPAPTYAATGLPTGIVFNATTRVISGTPTSAAFGNILIRATNSQGFADWTIDYTTAVEVIPIVPLFSDDTGDAQSWTVGTAITSVTVPAATGNPTPTHAATGLPTGIVFNPATRVLSGTPSAAGSGTITVTATNSQGTADWTVTYTTAAEVVPVSSGSANYDVIAALPGAYAIHFNASGAIEDLYEFSPAEGMLLNHIPAGMFSDTSIYWIERVRSTDSNPLHTDDSSQGYRLVYCALHNGASTAGLSQFLFGSPDGAGTVVNAAWSYIIINETTEEWVMWPAFQPGNVGGSFVVYTIIPSYITDTSGLLSSDVQGIAQSFADGETNDAAETFQDNLLNSELVVALIPNNTFRPTFGTPATQHPVSAAFTGAGGSVTAAVTKVITRSLDITATFPGIGGSVFAGVTKTTPPAPPRQFDIPLYGSEPTVEVDWGDTLLYDHVLSNMSGRWVDFTYRFGSHRRANPQRPTVDAGTGAIRFYGDDFLPGRSTTLTIAQLEQRHLIRVTKGAVLLFEAYVLEAKHLSFISTDFRLEGILEQPGRAEKEVSSNAPVDSTVAAIAELFQDAYGLENEPELNVHSFPLAPFSFKGKAARLASDYGIVTGGQPTALPDGGLGFFDPGIPPPSTPLVLSGDQFAIAHASTEHDTEQIFNSADVMFTDLANVIAGTQTLEIEDERTFASRTDTLTFTIPAVDLTAYEGFTVVARAYGRYVSRFYEQFSTDDFAPPDWVYNLSGSRSRAIGPGDGATITATLAEAVQSDGSVIVTVTVVRTDWPGTYSLTSQGTDINGNIAAYTADDSTYSALGPSDFLQPARAYGGPNPFLIGTQVEITVHWNARTTLMPENVEVQNPISVSVWGERRLNIPPWYGVPAPEDNVQDRIDRYGLPRRIHTVDVELYQGDAIRDAQVAGLRPGQHVGLDIHDIADRTDISGVGYILSAEYRLDLDRSGIKRLVVLDTGEPLP